MSHCALATPTPHARHSLPAVAVQLPTPAHLRDRSRDTLVIEACRESFDADTGVQRVRGTIYFEGQPSFSAIILLAESYRQDVPLELADSRGDGPWPIPVEEVYGDHRMFHGPAFHTIAALHTLGNPGASGTLKAMPRDRLFAHGRRAQSRLDDVISKAGAVERNRQDALLGSNRRLDDVLTVGLVGARDIAGEGEARQAVNRDVGGAADAELMHAAAPDGDAAGATDVMRAPRLCEPAEARDLDIDDSAGVEVAGAARRPASRGRSMPRRSSPTIAIGRSPPGP